jgi:hypothetical protein
MKTRLLGTAGMLASPMLLISGMRTGFQMRESDRVNAALGLVFLAGWACSLIGLRRLRATGNGAGGAVLLALQAVGLLLAVYQQLQDLSAHPNTQGPLYQIANLAWPASVAWMVVVGGAAIAAGKLTGWRRSTPLLCGLALPLLFGTMAMLGQQEASLVFGLYTTMAWALLGLAIRSSSPTP